MDGEKNPTNDGAYQSPISPGISWYETSVAERPRYAALDGSIKVDVVIVGGGFTGLSAAYHLAKTGSQVALIESYRFGDGASGRNGGQMGTGQRAGVEELEDQYGFERSKALFELAEEAKKNLHEVARTNGFDYDYVPGQITAMFKARECAGEQKHLQLMRDRYGYSHLTWLDRDAVNERIGTNVYHGGIADAGTGHIHPLKYLVGLARAASESGAQLYEETPAIKLASQNGKVVVETRSGTISAERCLLATNGYGDGLDKINDAHVMPIRSFIGATEPLPENSTVLPAREAVDDSRFVVRYFRKTLDNRLLFGGREAYTAANPGDISKHIRRQMTEIYPELKDTRLTHAWGGSVAITMPRQPFVREVKPGIISVGGFSGHGVMLSNFTGKLVAEAFTGNRSRLDLMADLDVKPFPGGRMFQKPLLVAALTWYSMLDKI